MSSVYRSALVTGACGGIGYAIVKQLAEKGYEILATSARCADAANPLFQNLNATVHYVAADLGSEEGRAAVLNAAASFPRIDVLINVAGIAPRRRVDLLNITEESFDEVLAINTKGTLFLTQAIAKKMLSQDLDRNDQRGYIINISSVSAYATSLNRGEYCISKAGVSMITKLFAHRLAAEHITVNEIRPGIIATEMTKPVQAKYDRLIANGLLPNPRWGTPEDVASAVLALCSGALRYTTGQAIDVDGGFHLVRL